MNPLVLFFIAVAIIASLGAAFLGVDRSRVTDQPEIASDPQNSVTPAQDNQTHREDDNDLSAPGSNQKADAKLAPSTTEEKPLKQPDKTAAFQVEEATPAEDETNATEISTETVPTFDIVRIEKNGSLLVAGKAMPLSTVTLLNNETPIGSAEADNTGSFVILPDGLLKGDDNEISLQTKQIGGATAFSGQRVAISIVAEGEALIAVLEDGKAVNIVQRPSPKKLAQSDLIDDENTLSASKIETHNAAESVGDEGSASDHEQELTSQSVASEKQNKLEAIPDKGKVKKTASNETDEGSGTRIARLVDETNDPTPSNRHDDEKPNAKTEGRLAKGAQLQEQATSRTVSRSTKSISVSAVEVENDTFFAAGQTAPNEVVRIYLNNRLVGDANSGPGGRWLLQQIRPLDSGTHQIRADLLESDTSKVVARAVVPFVIEDLTASGLAKVKIGKVIIRKNDNLWTIAKRLYGNGQRYTAIFQQNRDQIKDPELIFPGQIFTVPQDVQLTEGVDTLQKTSSLPSAHEVKQE